MDNNKALQNLLNGTATEEEINLLKREIVSGNISIGGNINQSVIIIGNGNTVELPPAALDRLGGRFLLGGLDRDLTGDEIDIGLNRLEAELPIRAPILLAQFQSQAHHLRPTLKTNLIALSDHARKAHIEALAQINSLCVETLDISFNALCLGEEPPDYDSRSPFRGLESFRPEDGEFFFGRESLIKKLASKIKSHPFLAVLGASGSGKSSLVMAGLIPALGSQYIIVRPGANPLEVLESVKEDMLVIVDQFEELFTLNKDDATRKQFITRLLETTKHSKVVITLRSDFLGDAGMHRSLKEEIQNHLEIVPPMDIDELHHAMNGQANAVGLRFEADLSQQILDDVEGEPGAMPLLQHALWELWNRRHGCNLRASEYRAFGGVKKAISSTAKQVYERCSSDEQEQIRNIFVRLTRLDESDEGRDTRKRVLLGDLVPSGQDVISAVGLLDKLANARLIVKTLNDEKIEVEVAHEALIRYWETLRTWLNRDRDNLRLLQGVREDARDWENMGRNPSLLNHRSERLEIARFLGNQPLYKLTTLEQVYLQACFDFEQEQITSKRIAAENLEREKSQRMEEQLLANYQLGRRNVWLVTALITALILASLAIGFGFNYSKQKKDAIARTEELKNLAIADQANKAIEDHNPDLALALAMNASEKANPSGITYSALLDSAYISLSQKIFAVCKQPNAWVTALDIDHDDRLAAVGCSVDGKSIITLLNLETGNVEAEWPYSAWLYGLDFNRDDQTILAGYSDATAIVWNLDGTRRFSLEKHTAAVSAVAFNPKKQIAATASYDKTIAFWDVNTGDLIYQISGSTAAQFQGKFVSLDFSPDGNEVTFGDDIGNIYIINPDAWTFKALDTWDQQEKFVLDLSFTPDGSKIFSSSTDSTITIWNRETDFMRDYKLDISKAYPGVWIKSIAFTRDGDKLLTALSNGEILLWNARSFQIIQHLEGHHNEVENLSISSDGTFALSGGRDGILRLWDLQATDSTGSIKVPKTSSEINDIILTKDDSLLLGGSANGLIQVWSSNSHDLVDSWSVSQSHAAISEILLSPDEKNILTATSNGDVIYQSMENHQTLWDASTPGDNARSIDISLDGKSALIGYSSGKITVLDMESGELTCTLHGHTNSVNSVRFTPNGKNAISGSNDYNVILWNLSTCEMDRTLFRHDGWVMSLAISPDGNFLASTSADGTTILWNMVSNQLKYRLRIPEIDTNPGLDGMGLSVDFSSDGQLLAAGSANGSLAIWSVNNGVLLRRFIPDLETTCEYAEHCFWVLSTQFNTKGNAVWASSADGVIRAWPLIQAPDIAVLREWLLKNRYIPTFTSQEKEAYGIDQ